MTKLYPSINGVLSLNFWHRLAILFLFSPISVCSLERDPNYRLPKVPAPVENQITPEKISLGKILFWDEQLSTDNSIACGTCHIPSSAGADNRLARTQHDNQKMEPAIARHPGYDNQLKTKDDLFTSFGVIKRNKQGHPSSKSEMRQVTARTSQNFFGTLWANEHFWDGRARGEFIDPDTREILINRGASLESQVLGPLMSDVEMAKSGQLSTEVTNKLRLNRPLALASKIPSDIKTLINEYQSYPVLFEKAFGDQKITLTRIAFAIASYERSLVPDQSPWDTAVQSGEPLPYLQNLGWEFFQKSGCIDCHVPPTFTDDKFYNIGIQGQNADSGHFVMSQQANDIGAMKVPTLRNVGLKQNFMHTGQFSTLEDVFKAYEEVPYKNIASKRPDGEDYNFQFTAQQRKALMAFLSTSLTDPRVAAETFPFDRPSLRTEKALQTNAKSTHHEAIYATFTNVDIQLRPDSTILVSWDYTKLLPKGWDVEIERSSNQYHVNNKTVDSQNDFTKPAKNTRLIWTTNNHFSETTVVPGEINTITLRIRDRHFNVVDTQTVTIDVPYPTWLTWLLNFVVFVLFLWLILFFKYMRKKAL